MSAAGPPPPPRPSGDGDDDGDRRGKRPRDPDLPAGNEENPKTAPTPGGAPAEGATEATPGASSGRVRMRVEGISSGDPTQQPCMVCGKTFKSWKALYGHMRCHPERDWRGIIPPSEASGQGSRPEIREREVAASLILLSGVGGAGESVAQAAVPVAAAEGGGYPCTNCGRVFETRQALGGHRASHKNVKGCFARGRGEGGSSNPTDGAGSSAVAAAAGIQQSGGVEEENKGSGEGQHKCNVCSSVFESEEALSAHMRTHTPPPGGETGPASSRRGVAGSPLDLNRTYNSPPEGDAAGPSSPSRRGLPLDLNLPAPGEKDDDSPPSIDLNR